MVWICGNCKTDVGWRGNSADSVDVESLNPTWNNPVDIMQAIKNVPCGKCGGSGNTKFMGAYGGVIRPCSCNNGVIDEWDGFMEWHQDQFDGLSMVMSTFDKGFLYRIIGHASAEILLTPSLLMQDYLSYKEVE
jgi:hypothetical protein